MPIDINHVTIRGRAHQVEARQTADNRPVLNFVVTCERTFIRRGQVKVDRSDVPCVAYDARARDLRPVLAEGDNVYVAGRLSREEWGEPNTRWRMVVVVDQSEVVKAPASVARPRTHRQGG
jgi:single-stranded DNA-binding protein